MDGKGGPVASLEPRIDHNADDDTIASILRLPQFDSSHVRQARVGNLFQPSAITPPLHIPTIRPRW
jgi:hypothetical protein